MESFGEMIRRLREKKGEPLRKLASFLDIDQAIMSKIERGQRKATKKHIKKLADYFEMNEKELLIAWLSDQIANEIQEESIAKEALKVAEKKIEYLTKNKLIN